MPIQEPFPTLESLGFSPSSIKVKPYTLDVLEEYLEKRDLPYLEGTSRLSPHLRFGTVSIRSLAAEAEGRSETFLKELVWREFFMQILYHHPRVVTENYQKKYDGIPWRNNEEEFDRWCKGKTGFPMVDAGMRQLDQTGFMHNRVRMVCASFLCKHLLVDWRWGEAWFARKLLDYELSSNNGNWQWAAGTGCDAAPYFRVFNPSSQQEKFDPGMKYTRRWVPEVGSDSYPAPVVDHRMARERAIRTYKEALSQE
jgi:deoxyribodipyrimidine photo-lyase